MFDEISSNLSAINILLVLVNLILSLVVCSFLIHALLRLRWHGRGGLAPIVAIIVCAQIWLLPNLLGKLLLSDSRHFVSFWFADWLATIFTLLVVPLSSTNIPREIEDSARIDGSGFLHVYWHILLPSVWPILSGIAILLFCASAGELLRPPATNIDLILSLVMTLPLIAVFFWGRRYLLRRKNAITA
jgi:multiple sugar transport system permease protein